MKTILSLATTLVLIVGLTSLDNHQLTPEVIFPALAVATLAAFALNDRTRPTLRIRSGTVTQFPPARRYAASGPSHRIGLAA
jgi:hypothetical protein